MSTPFIRLYLYKILFKDSSIILNRSLVLSQPTLNRIMPSDTSSVPQRALCFVYPQAPRHNKKKSSGGGAVLCEHICWRARALTVAVRLIRRFVFCLSALMTALSDCFILFKKSVAIQGGWRAPLFALPQQCPKQINYTRTRTHTHRSFFQRPARSISSSSRLCGW